MAGSALDLEEQRVGLLREMNQMKIDLQKCEDRAVAAALPQLGINAWSE